MNEEKRTVRSERRYLFDSPRNVRRVIWLLYAACFGSFAADALIDRHIDHPWEALFGFYGIYGFVACVLLVLIAKELRRVLMRKDRYYDE
jgi:bacteriorhodopsin